MTVFLISTVCFLVGFACGVLVAKQANDADMQHLEHVMSEGYFLNSLLTGLAQVLFHEHQDTVYEVPVHGTIYRVYQEENDILFKKK